MTRTLPSARRARSRRVVAAVCVTGVALALAACGPAASDGADTTSDSAALLPAAEGTTAYPLTVETAWGEITIDERPQRIAATESSDFALLVALGVTPVASHDDEALYVPWADDVLVQNAETWAWGEIAVPAEIIAKEKVDLTVAMNWGLQPLSNIDQLSAVAPVLAQPELGGETAGWRDKLETLGEVLDLQKRAQELIDGYDPHFAALRAEYPEFAGKTVAVLEFWDVEEAAFSSAAGGDIERMFVDMGFAANPGAEIFAEDPMLSQEMLGRIEADVVIAFDYAVTREEFTEWIASPLFQQIDAVQQGRLLTFTWDDRRTLTQDGETIAAVGQTPMVFNDPIGTPNLADVLAPFLAEALAD